MQRHKPAGDGALSAAVHSTAERLDWCSPTGALVGGAEPKINGDKRCLARRGRGCTMDPRHLRKIYDAVREPLVVLDPDLRICSANASFYGIFNLVPADAAG